MQEPKASFRPSAGAPAMRFRLVRYFTLASLGMFLLVALALGYFERQQSDFFKRVQVQQSDFFKHVQDGFARQQEESARRDLLTIHENGNVNLTRLFANALWEKDFAPFVAKAQSIDVAHCRAIADVVGDDGKSAAPEHKKACFAEVGARIRAFPEFRALDAKVFDAMKKSTVFKIKVFDLRGITVYSSEHAQMGEDKLNNAGWKSAAAGKPASELVHKAKFSAFEGVVENRDLISSYLPVLAPGSDTIVGVFEIYSDVSPFLDQIKRTSALIKQAALENHAKVAQAAADNEARVEQTSLQGMAMVAGVMALLFGALFVIVRRADRIIAQQAKDREHFMQQLTQSEKMASLGQMVAGVAHQLNTPLAFSYNNVSLAIEGIKNFHLPLKVANAFARLVKSVDGDQVTVNVAPVRAQVESMDAAESDVMLLTEMLGDTLKGIDQMRELVDNLRDFTRLDRAKVTAFDVNAGLHNVVYIAKSTIPTGIRVVEEYAELPRIQCNPSQLNQVFLNLITNAAQAITGEGTVRVRTCLEQGRVRVDVEDDGSGIAPDVLPHIFETYYTTKPAGEGTGLGLPIARSIVTEHGGEIRVRTEVGKGTTFTVLLPVGAQ